MPIEPDDESCNCDHCVPDVELSAGDSPAAEVWHVNPRCDFTWGEFNCCLGPGHSHPEHVLTGPNGEEGAVVPISR